MENVTCYRFWRLLTIVYQERTRAAWGAFLHHIDHCEACQWWHSQPLVIADENQC